MSFRTMGIDLAKDVFQVCARDAEGRLLFNKPVPRSKLLSFVSQQPVSLIGMEACGGSHYWAKEFQKLGHTVKLMAPQFVSPYVKANKNDAHDAEGHC